MPKAGPHKMPDRSPKKEKKGKVSTAKDGDLT